MASLVIKAMRSKRLVRDEVEPARAAVLDAIGNTVARATIEYRIALQANLRKLPALFGKRRVDDHNAEVVSRRCLDRVAAIVAIQLDVVYIVERAELEAAHRAQRTPAERQRIERETRQQMPDALAVSGAAAIV